MSDWKWGAARTIIELLPLDRPEAEEVLGIAMQMVAARSREKVDERTANPIQASYAQSKASDGMPKARHKAADKPSARRR